MFIQYLNFIKKVKNLKLTVYKFKVRLYIFISTNSIYDNCETINIKDREIKEEEAVRPKSKVF